MKNEKIPYGYNLVDGKLVVNEEEADKLRSAIEEYLHPKGTKEPEETPKGTVVYTRACADVSADISFSEQVDRCIDFADENEMTVIELDPDKPTIHKLIENAQADGCEIIVIIKERN